MESETQAVERPAGTSRRTLDLFAFPPDTQGWFRMLVVAACLDGLNLGFLTAQRVFGSPRDDIRERLASFVAETMYGRRLPDLSPSEMEELGHQLSVVTQELLRARLPQLAIAALIMLLLFAGATAVYLDHPRRHLRRHNTQPLRADDAPTVVRDVERWTASLGLSPLRLEHRPGLGNDAQTFGLGDRGTLVFRGEPRLLERVWGDTLKTIALHELGHVKNGDAQEREKSRAIWIAMVGMPLLAAGGWLGDALLDLAAAWRTADAGRALDSLAALARSLLQDGWRLAVLLLLAVVIWRRMLQTREPYADRRVASWGMRSALERLLRPPQGEGLWHPSNQDRLKALADPTRLFRVSPILALVTGALLSILAVTLIFPLLEIAFIGSLAAATGLWRDLAPHLAALPAPWGKWYLLGAAFTLNMTQILLLFLVPLTVLSYLAAGTLGVQVQRETMADLDAGHPGQFHTWGYARLWKPAALLALGVEAGFRVAPFNAGLELSIDARLLVPWLAGLTCLTWLWLAYVRGLTRFTLGTNVGAILSLRLRRFVNASSVLLLTALYWPAGFARLAPRTSFWMQVARQNPTDDPREVFVYSIVMTSVVLATLAILVYLGAAGASLAGVFVRLRRLQPRCSSCGEPASLGFAVGRCCALCDEQLAAWAYEAAPLDLDRRPQGEPHP